MAGGEGYAVASTIETDQDVMMVPPDLSNGLSGHFDRGDSVDEATRSRLGEQTEPGDRGPAPGPLRLVQQFLNTHNHEFPPDADRLGTLEKAGHWLVGHGLLPMG